MKVFMIWYSEGRVEGRRYLIRIREEGDISGNNKTIKDNNTHSIYWEYNTYMIDTFPSPRGKRGLKKQNSKTSNIISRNCINSSAYQD